MEIGPIPRDAFEGVRERVPEIQNFSQARFMLIFGHDARFLGDGTLDDIRERGTFPAQYLLQFLFEKLGQPGVANHSVLDDFVDSRSKFARRQAAEENRIAHHTHWRVKRAHQILTFRKIYSCLAADGAIDLRHDGGGNMDHRDSACIARRNKAGHVADDSSSGGNDERAAVRARADKIAAGALDGRKIFGGFRVIDQNRRAPPAPEQPFDARAPMPPHSR